MRTTNLHCNVAQASSHRNKFDDVIPKLRPKGGGAVVGRVNREGHLTGYRLAYIYPGQTILKSSHNIKMF
jgi:hypothetical protein